MIVVWRQLWYCLQSFGMPLYVVQTHAFIVHVELHSLRLNDGTARYLLLEPLELVMLYAAGVALLAA
jgi:hypothetical protein